MKILFYTNIPSPYRVAFFNELGKHCELTVVFETANSTERDDAWKKFDFKNFKGIILKGIRTRVDAAFCPGIIKYLRKGEYDQIVVTQLASLTAIWAAAYMRIRGIPYCYEGDGGFVGNIKGVKAAIKRFIIGNSKYCFSTSESFDEYCLAYGAKKEKLYRYPFTSIEEKDVLKNPLTKDQKLVFRKELNMKEEKILLSVGQFIYRKGFDLLMEMCRSMPKSVGIYIVGGTPTEEYLELKEKWDLSQVHFVDFMKKDQLSRYYQAADAFVLPTREDIWGLVVNEAMANGLPVISTERCAAALEMVRPGENGYIVPINDVGKLRKAVDHILDSDERRNTMAKNALKTVRENYTIENMTKEHIRIFEKELG